MVWLVGLFCLLAGIAAVMAGRRIRVPEGPQEELRGLARAGLIVGGGLLLLVAIALFLTALGAVG